MRLDDTQVERIVDSYETYGGIAARAARELPHALTTIQSCWEEHGLPVKRSDTPRADGKYTSALTDAEVERIYKAYERYNGNASLAAKHLPWSCPTIRKYWRKKGLPIHKLGGKRTPLETSLEQRID